jgi:MFS family permease
MQQHTPMPRVAAASAIGTILEWYDFALYNAMSGLVFNKIFLPSFDPLVGTLLSFLTYGVGMVARPVGGIICGRLGDIIGRRPMLIATVSTMGATTALIGLLPSYHQIGALAPILLVILRFVQGIMLGGEWAGAVLLSVEHGSAKRRGLNASWNAMRHPWRHAARNRRVGAHHCADQQRYVHCLGLAHSVSRQRRAHLLRRVAASPRRRDAAVQHAQGQA